MTRHAVLSPSSSGLWTNCPGSLKHSSETKFNYVMAEGTLAHFAAEQLLKDGEMKKQTYLVGNGGGVSAGFDGGVPAGWFEVEYDSRMAEHVEKYVQYVRGVSANAFGLRVETLVDISGLTDERGACGTIDAAFYDPKANMYHIIDLKYGFNEVPAADNTQLIMYAWAYANQYPETESPPNFMLHIYQPRCYNTGTVVVYTFSELMGLAADIQKAADRTRSNPDDVIAGQHCYKHYCPAMATCVAARNLVDDVVKNDLPYLDTYTISSRLKFIPFIRKWCNAVEQDAETMAIEQGVKIDGFKVVEGRAGARKWLDETEADKIMAAAKLKVDQRRTYKVISPTQAEKLFKTGSIPQKKWEVLQENITRKDARLKLVPEEDKRKAVEVTPAVDALPNYHDFDDLI